jgi:hypothetical protein
MKMMFDGGDFAAVVCKLYSPMHCPDFGFARDVTALDAMIDVLKEHHFSMTVSQPDPSAQISRFATTAELRARGTAYKAAVGHAAGVGDAGAFIAPDWLLHVENGYVHARPSL